MKTIRKVKVLAICCSALLCALGVVLMAVPDISAKVVCILLGALCVACGLTKVIGYFSYDLYNLAFQFDLALGIFVTAVGVLLLAHPERVMTFFPVVIGLFILTDGVFKLQTSVDAKRFGLPNWWLILLGALLCIALSMLLIFDPFGGGQVLMVLIGASLLLDGMANLFNVLYTVKILKHEKQKDPFRIGEDAFTDKL